MENSKIHSQGLTRMNVIYFEAAVLTVLVIVIAIQHKTLAEVKKINNKKNEGQ
jgi:hypothetical protein